MFFFSAFGASNELWKPEIRWDKKSTEEITYSKTDGQNLFYRGKLAPKCNLEFDSSAQERKENGDFDLKISVKEPGGEHFFKILCEGKPDKKLHFTYRWLKPCPLFSAIVMEGKDEKAIQSGVSLTASSWIEIEWNLIENIPEPEKPVAKAPETPKEEEKGGEVGGFFMGMDVGLELVTVNTQDPYGTSGNIGSAQGFFIHPGIGWSLEKWKFFLSYEAVFISFTSSSTVSIKNPSPLSQIDFRVSHPLSHRVSLFSDLAFKQALVITYPSGGVLTMTSPWVPELTLGARVGLFNISKGRVAAEASGEVLAPGEITSGQMAWGYGANAGLFYTWPLRKVSETHPERDFRFRIWSHRRIPQGRHHSQHEFVSIWHVSSRIIGELSKDRCGLTKSYF